MGCTKSRTDDRGPPSRAVDDKRENKNVNKASTSSATLWRPEGSTGEQSSTSTSIVRGLSGKINRNKSAQHGLHSGLTRETSVVKVTKTLELDIYSVRTSGGTGPELLNVNKCCLLLWESDNRPVENKDYTVLNR